MKTFLNHFFAIFAPPLSGCCGDNVFLTILPKTYLSKNPLKYFIYVFKLRFQLKRLFQFLFG